MRRELTAIECFVLLLLAVALALHYISANAQEMTKRDLFLNDVRAANMAESHQQIKCMQERWVEGKPWNVCITEAEWHRQHKGDK